MSSSSVESQAILLRAIFPSLHPDVAREIAATTCGVAHAARRAYHIAHPISTFGVEVDDANVEDVRRVHHEYMRSTVVHGVQVTDVSHHQEYNDTVVAVVVKTKAWDVAQANAVAESMKTKFNYTPVGTLAHPVTPSTIEVWASAPPLLTPRSDSTPVVISPSSQRSKALVPHWLPTDEIEMSAAPSSSSTPSAVKRREFDERKWTRCTAPVQQFSDVFSHLDHRCSLRKELYVNGRAAFEARWKAAMPHLLNGLSSVLCTVELLPPSAGVEMMLPVIGACLVTHSSLKVRSCSFNESSTTVQDAPPAKTKKHRQHQKNQGEKHSRQHEPIEAEMASPHGTSHAVDKEGLLCFKTSQVCIELEPLCVSYAPVDRPSKVKHERITLKVKGVSLKIIGDFHLSPAGKHLLHVETAKVHVTKLSVSTKSTLRNIVLFLAGPILRHVVETEVAKALKGKRVL